MALPTQKEKDLFLRIIYNELEGISHKWFKIGIQLGIPHYKLKEFEEECDPLSAVIEYWLAGTVPESDVPASWKSIVAALKVDSIGEPDLAEQIHKKYCQQDEDTAGQSPPDVQLDSDVRNDQAEENLKEICTQYANYVDCLCGLLKEKQVSPEDLRSFLLSLPAFSKAFKGQNSALLNDQKSEVVKKNTIDEIVQFLATNCASFLNPNIFRKIIKAYNIGTEKETLKYENNLQVYIQTHKLSELVTINPQIKSNESYRDLTLKLDIESTCTLARVDELRKTLAKILNLKSSALQIADLKDGCAFLIPSSVADVLFTQDTVFTPQQEDELRAASVLWLKCNGNIFNLKRAEPQRNSYTEVTGLRKLQKKLTCSICFSTYMDPKLLQCNHSYCQLCLIRLVQHDMQGQPFIACPTCRHTTPVPASGVSGLPPDFRINQLLEILGHDLDGAIASYRRGSLARQESVWASPIASSEEVEKKEASFAQFRSHCPEHGKIVELYCHTCSESICLKCALKGGKHQEHVCEELELAIEKCVSLSLAEIENALAQVDMCAGGLSDQQEAIEADISDTILPDVRKADLISKLHQLAQSKVKSLAMKRDQIETIQVQFKKLLHMSREDKAHLAKSMQKARTLNSTLQTEQLNKEDALKLSDVADITSECQLHGLVSDRAPDPSKSYVSDDTISTLAIGEMSSVVVHTLDCHGQPCKGINAKSITGKLVSKKTSKAIRCCLKQKDETHYEISYQPNVTGRHQLHIYIKGQSIAGSPFSITALKTPFQTIFTIGHGGIAINYKNEVVVADEYGQQLSVFSPNGEKFRNYSTLTSSKRISNQVAVDEEGNMFVTDSGDHCIRKFTLQGKLLVEMDFDIGEIHSPSGIAVYRDSIYVVSGECVVKLDSTLSSFEAFGGHGSCEGQFNQPRNIACDHNGNVYVADRGNCRIQVFSAEGKFLRVIGSESEGEGGLTAPHGIAVGSERLYISDFGNHCVSVFTLKGDFVTSFGEKGNKPGQFLRPRGLALDKGERVLYVCDTENDRIQIFRVA